eukprot:TRINITY_DN24684_c0_g1_i1.p1 TRINITY_DN24684_c0_g1~~TRINITY_DN24684_c0_g1_i1.p1  ORF type:complete len:687 (-),score=129.68 TRINITY_DN24684_c0_g1_i1:109-2169(-)
MLTRRQCNLRRMFLIILVLFVALFLFHSTGIQPHHSTGIQPQPVITSSPLKNQIENQTQLNTNTNLKTIRYFSVLGVGTSLADEYKIGSVLVPEVLKGKWIVGFEPVVGASVHHLALSTCPDKSRVLPNTKEEVVGDEVVVTIHYDHQSRFYCPDAQDVMVWAHQGSPFYFPRGIALYLGPGGIETMQLLIHYSSIGNSKSGIRCLILEFPENHKPLVPYVYLLVPSFQFSVPPGQKEYYLTNNPLVWKASSFIFAIRVHGHFLSVRNIVTFSRDNKLFFSYERSTKLPQSFILLEQMVPVKDGDVLNFSCIYNSENQTNEVSQGAKKTDEMCNIYLYGFDSDIPNLDFPVIGPELNTETSPKLINWRTLKNISLSSQIVGVEKDNSRNWLWIFTRGTRIWNSEEFKNPISEFTILGYDLNRDSVVFWGGKNIFHMPHSVRRHPQHPNILVIIDVGQSTLMYFDVETSEIVARTDGTVMSQGGVVEKVERFCQPTDVVFVGNVAYVSDGYCNHRVVKLDSRDLSFLGSFPLSTKLGLPVVHSLAHYKCDSKGGGGGNLLFVLSREESAVFIIDLETNIVFSESFSFWDHKIWFSYSVAVVNDLLVVGLVRRDFINETYPNFRKGGLWVGVLKCPFCLDSMKGEFHEIWGLEEPHLLSSSPSDNRVYVAEAVDGIQKGSVWEVYLGG